VPYPVSVETVNVSFATRKIVVVAASETRTGPTFVVSAPAGTPAAWRQIASGSVPMPEPPACVGSVALVALMPICRSVIDVVAAAL
jgi:hypothetical protein